jgi:hypothetical protein
MRTIKKAQTGAKVKKPVTKPKEDKYKGLGGEIGRPIFSDKEQRERRKKLGLPTSKAEEKAYYEKMRREGAKNGRTMSKAKNGTSLGMKSVKAGFDKNPGVTRADIITAATKKAQNGKILPIKKSKVRSNPAFELEYQKFKHKQDMDRMKLDKERKAKEASYPKSNKAKSGSTVKKCKYGCK